MKHALIIIIGLLIAISCEKPPIDTIPEEICNKILTSSAVIHDPYFTEMEIEITQLPPNYVSSPIGGTYVYLKTTDYDGSKTLTFYKPETNLTFALTYKYDGDVLKFGFWDGEIYKPQGAESLFNASFHIWSGLYTRCNFPDKLEASNVRYRFGSGPNGINYGYLKIIIT